jgi:2,4-dienoyl-CoA reductase-like NADH-dependent reductase (Old Yellow Enzyme family)/thioredoxin reductase
MVFEKLFSPVQIGRLEVKNRIVFPPMGIGRATADGKVTEHHIHWYETRAKGGVGLIIVESTSVSRFGSAGPGFLGIWQDDNIPRLRKLVQTIHDSDSRVFIQLGHAGRQSSTAFTHGARLVAPSAISCPVRGEIPDELSIQKIDEIIREYAEAAIRAQTAGFDGIEIHGAHGYLIAEFMSPYANKRHDAYGGDLRGRMRFPLEIIQAVRTKVGEDFPISFRLSANEYVPDGNGIEASKRMARLFEEAGVDCLHASAGVYESLWSIFPTSGTAEGVNASDAAAIKQVVGIPVITVGRIKSPEIAEEILKQEKADMVAIGRQLICDPDWPLKAAAGDFDEIRPCIGCTQGCINREMVTGESPSCIYNPAAGMEMEAKIIPTEARKKVLVIGGGPGGLEAARVAALRGHQVKLCEKDRRLGGRFNLACIAPFKQEFTLAIKWLSQQVRKLGVDVELGVEVTPKVVDEVSPDAIILATGAVGQMPAIPGIDGQVVAFGEDILSGKVGMGNRVVIIGAGGVGTEVADFLAQRGKRVTIVEMLPEVGPLTGIPVAITQLLMPRLARYRVEIKTSTTVKEITDSGVVVTKDGKEETIPDVDQVIVATGPRSADDLVNKIKGKVREMYVIGDAKKPRSAFEATREGAEAGQRL